MNLVDIFFSSFRSGGIVMWPILVVSLVVWYTGFGRLVVLWSVRASRRRFLRALRDVAQAGARGRSTGDSAYDTLLSMVASGVPTVEPEYAYRQFMVGMVPRLDDGFATMTAWISAAPLLGLLGTVVGMVQTFRVITEFGIDNPHLMASGISVALLTTQAGLTVAFPSMLFHNYLLGSRNKLVAAMRRDGEVVVGRLGSEA